MIKLYRNDYKLDKVALFMKFSKREFFYLFLFKKGMMRITDDRHCYREYVEYKGEAFDIKHNTIHEPLSKYFGYEEPFLAKNGYLPPEYLKRSLLIPMY